MLHILVFLYFEKHLQQANSHLQQLHASHTCAKGVQAKTIPLFKIHLHSLLFIDLQSPLSEKLDPYRLSPPLSQSLACTCMKHYMHMGHICINRPFILYLTIQFDEILHHDWITKTSLIRKYNFCTYLACFHMWDFESKLKNTYNEIGGDCRLFIHYTN